jgi:hypothetical protein
MMKSIDITVQVETAKDVVLRTAFIDKSQLDSVKSFKFNLLFNLFKMITSIDITVYHVLKTHSQNNSFNCRMVFPWTG